MTKDVLDTFSTISNLFIRRPQATSMFFNPQYKLSLHIIQLLLIAVAIGFTAPRMFMKNQPRTRANTIALGMVCTA